MKKATTAALFVTAAAALYGAAAYGVTRTLMDVAMKREAPKALKNKGSAQLTGEKRDEPYREAQRAAAKKLASSETETVLLENREGLTLVGHLRECEKAKRLVKEGKETTSFGYAKDLAMNPRRFAYYLVHMQRYFKKFKTYCR